VSDLNGISASRLTDTGGKVEEFVFSPALRYLAYEPRFLRR
jgi:hypothetical protein